MSQVKDTELKDGHISAEDFDKLVVPAQMVGNPRRDLGLA